MIIAFIDMDKNKAKQILMKSVSNLQQRRGRITVTDLEAEVINNACLTILKQRKNVVSEDENETVEEMIQNMIGATFGDHSSVIQAFVYGAMELFPEYYTEREAASAVMGIQNNIQWEGMWDFLRDYFLKNHGLRIDDVQANSTFFYSSRHKRYEDNNLVADSIADRTIDLIFTNNKKELVVSIAPTLSPKKSYLVSKDNKIYHYKGYDPDYLFHIFFDEFEEVEKFILELPNRKLSMHYFE